MLPPFRLSGTGPGTYVGIHAPNKVEWVLVEQVGPTYEFHAAVLVHVCAVY